MVFHFDFAFCNACPHLLYAKLWSCLYKYVIKLDYNYNLHNFALLNLKIFTSINSESLLRCCHSHGIIGDLRSDNGDRCPRKSRCKIDYSSFQTISRLPQVVLLQLYLDEGNLCWSRRKGTAPVFSR